MTIIKSKCDKREYRRVTLANQIRCLLVSDPEADKSAASLDVRVGAGLDPRPLYGTAHFLEHMLFQGTEKYPRENEYSEFMTNNGGMNNAYTSLTNTNYHFEVSNEAFEEGLDRLAQFFICPTFSEDATDREVNAVDSEFKQSLQHDGWHQYNLVSRLSDPESNLNRFHCGNCKSLQQPGMRQSLLDFHKKWYSSNIMTLSISGKHSLDDLEKWATDKFTAVENKDVVVPDLGIPAPYSSERCGKLVKFVPIQDKDMITFFWILPYFERCHDTKPLNYFSHLFGHEGENSLLSYLISEGLALGLQAGGDHELYSYSVFEVQVTLTAKGLANYDRVVEAVFQYAQRIKELGPQEYIFEETRDIGIMNFEFSDKGGALNTCVSLAKNMQIRTEDEMPQLLRSKYVADKFDREQIQFIAEQLCKFDALNIFLKSKSFEGQTTDVDEFYLTKYVVTDFSNELKDKIINPKCEIKSHKLDLPPANLLIPKNFDVLEKNETHSAKPILLKQWEDTDLWYKKDDKFERPKAFVNMKLYTGDCGFGKTIEGRLFCAMWQDITMEYLREFKYNAECANLNYEMALMHDNVNFTWSGYNDSMPNFISQTITKLLEMKQHDLADIFDQIKEKLMLDWKNAYFQQSYMQAFQAFDNFHIRNSFEKKHLRSLLEKYTYSNFQEDLKGWFKTGRFLWFINGNYRSDLAIELVEQTRKEFNIAPIGINELPSVEPIKIQEGTSHVVEVALEDKANDNSCILTYFEVGQDNDMRSNLIVNIVMQYLNEPFFDDLRTKQQLGYVVFSRSFSSRDVVGCQFLVQSPQKPCEYLSKAINIFLVETRDKIQSISDEDFKVQVGAVRTKIAEKDINLGKTNNRFWSEISTHKYNFDKQAQELAMLETITKEEMISYFNSTFLSSTSKRLDIELAAVAHAEDQSKAAVENSAHEAFSMVQRQSHASLGDFKQAMAYHPDYIKADFSKHRQ